MSKHIQSIWNKRQFVTNLILTITVTSFSACTQSVRMPNVQRLDSLGTWILVEDQNGTISNGGEFTVSEAPNIRLLGYNDKAYIKVWGNRNMGECQSHMNSSPQLFIASQDGNEYISCRNSIYGKEWELIPLNTLTITPHQRPDSYNFCVGQQCMWVVRSEQNLNVIISEYREKFQNSKSIFANKRQAVEKKTGKIRNDGRFGGGYREAKWGQTVEETAQYFSPLTVHPEDGNKFIHENEKLIIHFTYYMGVLAEVDVRLKIDGYDFTTSSEAREAIILKYGKPVTKIIRKGVDTLEGAPYAFRVRSLSWRDGTTSIDTTECEVLTGAPNGCLKEAEGLWISYESVKLAPFLAKSRKDKADGANKYNSSF